MSKADTLNDSQRLAKRLGIDEVSAQRWLARQVVEIRQPPSERQASGSTEDRRFHEEVVGIPTSFPGVAARKVPHAKRAETLRGELP